MVEAEGTDTRRGFSRMKHKGHPIPKTPKKSPQSDERRPGNVEELLPKVEFAKAQDLLHKRELLGVEVPGKEHRRRKEHLDRKPNHCNPQQGGGNRIECDPTLRGMRQGL